MTSYDGDGQGDLDRLARQLTALRDSLDSARPGDPAVLKERIARGIADAVALITVLDAKELAQDARSTVRSVIAPASTPEVAALWTAVTAEIIEQVGDGPHTVFAIDGAGRPAALTDGPLTSTQAVPAAAPTPRAGPEPSPNGSGGRALLFAAAAILAVGAIALVVAFATRSTPSTERVLVDATTTTAPTGPSSTTSAPVRPTTTSSPTTISTAPSADLRGASYCVIDTTPLNLREGPGIDHRAILAIPIDRCDVRDVADQPEVAYSTSGRPWRHVEWNGTSGWVADVMLAPG